MEAQRFQKLLLTLENYQRQDSKFTEHIFILKELLKISTFDLNYIGHAGTLLIGSENDLSKRLLVNGIKRSKDQIARTIRVLTDRKIIWRLTRQIQEPIELNKKSRKGFSSAIFILPTSKEFNPELYKNLKAARTFKDLDKIILKFHTVSLKGLKDKQLQDKVVLPRNYTDKKYKDVVRNSLIAVWNDINKGLVLRDRKDNKAVQKPKQQVIKDTGREIYIH